MIVVARALFIRTPDIPVMLEKAAVGDFGSPVHLPACENVCDPVEASCHDRERLAGCTSALTVRGISYLDNEDPVFAPQGIDSGSRQPSVNARWKFTNLWNRCEGTLSKDSG